jgi:hypothetical protein
MKIKDINILSIEKIFWCVTVQTKHNRKERTNLFFLASESVHFSSKELKISIYNFSIKIEAFELRHALHVQSRTRAPSTLP